jgi:large subunit ribosomal protein L25
MVDMIELKARKRDLKMKSKQLRRQGIIPAVLYGKHLDESVPIEISAADLAQFMKSNTVGSKLTLSVGRK